MLLLWLSLFKAETEEDFEKIQAMEMPVMSQAINAYYRITASSEFRERERLYEKARHDEAQALHHAELRGRERGLTEGMNKGQAEIVKRMYARGRSLEEISGMTDLPLEKVKQLVEQE